MSPRSLMIIGSLVAAITVGLSFIALPTAGTVFMGFAAGAVFGKGYGVWEERRAALKRSDG